MSASHQGFTLSYAGRSTSVDRRSTAVSTVMHIAHLQWEMACDARHKTADKTDVAVAYQPSRMSSATRGKQGHTALAAFPGRVLSHDAHNSRLFVRRCQAPCRQLHKHKRTLQSAVSRTPIEHAVPQHVSMPCFAVREKTSTHTWVHNPTIDRTHIPTAAPPTPGAQAGLLESPASRKEREAPT